MDFPRRRNALLRARRAAHGDGFFVRAEPFVDLMRQRAVRRDGDAVGFDVDVPLEGARALGVGDGDGGAPVPVFVGGEADDVAGIAVFQEVDLVQFQFVVFRGIEGNAVVDGQRNAAAGEKRDQIVDVLERRAAGGDDGRAAGGGDFPGQRPVADVGAGDFDDVDAQFHALADGGFVERRGHGDTSALADGFDERGAIFAGEPGFPCFSDVADVPALPVVLVDEVVHVPELELDGGLDAVGARDARELRDDFQPAFPPAPVVVGEFQNEKVFKDAPGVVHGGRLS